MTILSDPLIDFYYKEMIWISGGRGKSRRRLFVYIVDVCLTGIFVTVFPELSRVFWTFKTVLNTFESLSSVTEYIVHKVQYNPNVKKLDSGK